ncbi:zinc-dependent peptidase [Thiohalobacter sp. IOR34]|uniref:M90 family metallopeptidase n=1 Tax=Thiohalobacter sp. IOR34 TaxID=3057176 RepID=UPI0025B21AB3|nr:M90 family metallopeptidase [Thiohalobacter sp. IOR34]WJW76625.1 zinc-dependent peptidase [Thiohalobacter sp. IOR34]
MKFFRRYHTLKILRDHPIADGAWHETTKSLPLLHDLGAVERARLRKLVTLFLHKKAFTGVQGLEVNQAMRLTVAAQACLQILNLGLDAFDGWIEIVIYPGAFRVERQTADDAGLVHQEANILSGESWSRGPVILSWEDVERDSHCLQPGRNVVIHEFAHKLDMGNGRANGMPPLHPEMPVEAWSRALSEAYNTLLRQLQHHHPAWINPYAATDPAEFFAVLCEYFFTAPWVLHEHCPAVYLQLQSYFRQDTLNRRQADATPRQPGC